MWLSVVFHAVEAVTLCEMEKFLSVEVSQHPLSFPEILFGTGITASVID